MKHVISIRRAGLENLIKAFGDVRPHKYWKRERIWPKGKPSWRYFYDTPEDRERWKEEHTKSHAGEKVEHFLRKDIETIYEGQRKELPPTASLTEESISHALISRPTVIFSEGYDKHHRQPALKEEKQGLAPQRNITQRVNAALGMVPERVQKLARIGSILLSDRADEKQVERSRELGRPVPAAYMIEGRVGKRLVICADAKGNGANTAPHGDPHFGSSLTLTEEIVWHQMGLAALESLAQSKQGARELIEWKALSQSTASLDEKVSAFAQENWQKDFAESFACLMSNPKQLAKQASDRYNWLVANGFGNDKLPRSADAFAKSPQSDWAWYEAKKLSKVRRFYERLKDSAPSNIPFRSEKDQFYSISVGGNTIYFRIGPANADAEPGWDRMPENLDPELGTPIWDSSVANPFQSPSKYKEIYDANGNRLSAEAAWFYLKLADGDDKIEAKLPSELPEGDDMADLLDRKKWNIGRQIYNTHGQNATHTETEKKKERDAIKKYAKAGVLGEKRAKRWAWAPVPITEGEFFSKAPTFAFDGVREAEHQSYVRTDGGHVEKDHDSKGREVQKLAARAYEATTRDGRVARMVVNEDYSFEYGQKATMPVVVAVTDPKTGETENRNE